MKKHTFLSFLTIGTIALAASLFAVPSVSSAQYFDTQTGLPLQSSVSAQSPDRQCISLTSGMVFGSRDTSTGGDVSRLQAYLISKGYLFSTATGYYGRLTEAAVRSFQAKNSISIVGSVGPLTRARILSLSCGTTVTPTATSISYINPTSGPVNTQVTIHGSSFSSTDNTVQFGQGVVLHVPSYDNSTLTFTVPSSLNAACYYSTPACLMASQSVVPGTYSVSVKNANGTSNAVSFTVTSNPIIGSGLSPVVNGIDSPTTLRVGESGTWTIHASDPNNGNLYYSVVWGDEAYYTTAAASLSTAQSYSQSVTFTHVYNNAGVFSPSFTVRNSSGQSAVTSTTVNVTNSSNAGVPVITSVTPSSGSAQNIFTLTGTGFNSSSKIFIDGGVNRAIPVLSYTDSMITFAVPEKVPSNCYDYSGNCPVIMIYPTPTYSTVGSHQIAVANSNSSISNNVYITIFAVPTVPPGSSTTTGSSMTLALGQTGQSDQTIIQGGDMFYGLKITPNSIVEDSRCPTGVYCIQAGRVVVNSTFTVNSWYVYSANLTAGNGDTFVTPQGFKIKITDITPIRSQSGTISSGEYRITYLVSK